MIFKLFFAVLFVRILVVFPNLTNIAFQVLRITHGSSEALEKLYCSNILNIKHCKKLFEYHSELLYSQTQRKLSSRSLILKTRN